MGFRASGFWFRAWGLGSFRVSGFSFRAWGLGFRVSGFQGSGKRLGVWGLGFGVPGLRLKRPQFFNVMLRAAFLWGFCKEYTRASKCSVWSPQKLEELQLRSMFDHGVIRFRIIRAIPQAPFLTLSKG